ncbi:hypothetical protein E3N88_08585 [Mikania micrantha]|uniref:CCHC-type domain-containing protein n=1 Tax=Mikania micrantha TaxID=192012 RepID=A0A5N6PGM0_9ASTR|nr:hypothetical protein E3N88_08585 [Mikania micrantha]
MSSQLPRCVQLVDEFTTAGVTLDNQDVIRKFPGELFGILSAYQMELDAQESKVSHLPSGSAALYAPINNPPYQSYHILPSYLHFHSEDASISNSALMANDSSSSNKVTNNMCTPECLETLTVYKKINSQLCNELESLQFVKANFFEAERNYKEKIEEMEKTISSLKHEDTNKQCQIKNLLERLTTAKTELVLAESYRDKFLSQGEKYEKLFRMNDTSELVRKKGVGLGYNKMEPPSAYTPMVEIRCKPVTNLVYDDELDMQVNQSDDLSDTDPNNSTCSDESDIPIKPETTKTALRNKKRTNKTKKHSTVFVKAKNTGSTSSDEYVTCPSDKSKRGRSKDRKVNFSGKQANPKTNKSVGTSNSSLFEDQSSAYIKRDQQQHTLNIQTICLMCGEKNHFAADCFYNPRSRISSNIQGRGRKNMKKLYPHKKMTIFLPRIIQAKRVLRRSFSNGSSASTSEDIPKGYFAVYVGEEEKRRFVVAVSLLSQPAFQELLNQSEEEFGYNHPMGGLTIPCSEDVFVDLASRFGAL